MSRHTKVSLCFAFHSVMEWEVPTKAEHPAATPGAAALVRMPLSESCPKRRRLRVVQPGVRAAALAPPNFAVFSQ